MRTTKFLTYSNRVIFATTIILYATIFLGLMAQIVLGGFQILSGIILMFFYNKIKEIRQNQLLIYWGIISVYGLIWFSGLKFPSNDLFEFLYNVLIPLTIAGYFTFILESINEEK